MVRTAQLAPLLALAAFAGCGRSPDFQVHGATVIVESDAPFARRPDLPARVETTIDAALRYWGGRWSDLDRKVIVLAAGAHVTCDGSPTALGCYDGELRVATADPGTGTFSCVEQTVLVHEVGHAVIGDPLHTDPRWMQLEPVADALSGRIGYTTAGEGACEIWLSVWRHPLNRP